MRLFNRTRGDAVETPADRRELAVDAGWGAVSGWSILAGTLAAYGAVAVLLAGAAAVFASTDIETDISALNWDELSWGGAAIIAAVTFFAYVFGGYTAGRMARRAGATNGLLVAVVGVLLAVGLGGLVAATTDGDVITDRLRTVGVPTDVGEWGTSGIVAGLATLAAMILGSIVGGLKGDRWHTRLVTRALDPTVGPEAELHDELDDRHADAETRVHRATGGRAVAIDRSEARERETTETA